jgi:SAM-dependent methyltransferase
MSFDVAAEAYDGFMGRYSSLLSPQLADLAGVRSGQRALDVGCGTGALTGELVERLGPGAVVAADPSPPFVAAVHERFPDVEIHEAAAERLPFADGSFDSTLAQLVVHFMLEPVVGISEMARVTRRDGVVAACVWDYAGNRGPLGEFWRAVRELDPSAQDESHLPGVREGHLVELFEAAGLRSIETATLTADLEHPTFEAWWDPFTRGVGPAGAYVATLAPRQRAALRDRCRELLSGPTIIIRARAWAARGLA